MNKTLAIILCIETLIGLNMMDYPLIKEYGIIAFLGAAVPIYINVNTILWEDYRRALAQADANVARSRAELARLLGEDIV